MTGPPLFRHIQLEGFLSFGLVADPIPLTALNLIIGPNGSGKSNLVEALSVLRALPRDLLRPIRQSGGIRELLWRASPSDSGANSGFGAEGFGNSFSDGSGAGIPAARFELVIGAGHSTPNAADETPLRYSLVLAAEGTTCIVLDERLENIEARPDETEPYCYFGFESDSLVLHGNQGRRELRRGTIDKTQSILAQRRDPDTYPELTRLADTLKGIRIYRDWQFGPNAAARRPCGSGVRTDHLSEGLDNLPARLASLKRSPAVKHRLLELVRELAPSFDDFEVVPEGGALTLYLMEGGLSFPAHRLSDGTLHYLCLLAILVDPEPPPLMVIEEPELGLHPDILPLLKDLMVEASARGQLIITTHSTQLVDAMTDCAGSVLICEKQAGRSTITRLTQGEVDHWRKHGSLGSLWMAGHFGGTRW